MTTYAAIDKETGKTARNTIEYHELRIRNQDGSEDTWYGYEVRMGITTKKNGDEVCKVWIPSIPTFKEAYSRMEYYYSDIAEVM